MNWDSGFHLHPDERFLTMVGNSMKLPSSFADYINPNTSLFNPANINFKFFVYGTFPLILNKLLAIILNTDNYFSFTLQGRFLSAFFDLLVVVFVYKTVEILETKHKFSYAIKYFASFFYAISVLPIQLSHFFAVDTFLNFFIFSSFYYSLKYYHENKLTYLIISAFLFGLSIVAKVSGIIIAPLLLFFLVYPYVYQNNKPLKYPEKIVNLFLTLILFGLISYITTRLADPYMFEKENVLNPQISNLFIQNLKALSAWSNKDVWFPPAVQWIAKPPIIFSLINLSIFGVGMPYFIFFLIGIYMTLKRNRNFELIAVVFWILTVFLYQSIQFAKPMRYLISIYPFVAIFSGFGFYYLTKQIKSFFRILIIIIVLLYPLMYLSIYLHKTTRVEASVWIYNNIPNNSLILWEHWDDPLPLNGEQKFGKQFITEALPVFDIDTNEKMEKINSSLKNADYYILSSNRAWGSIPTVPKKYPLMSKFYKDLFNERLGFKKIKEFTSYPSLKYLGIPIDLNDDWAEESFTVYDHPKVLIYKKM